MEPISSNVFVKKSWISMDKKKEKDFGFKLSNFDFSIFQKNIFISAEFQIYQKFRLCQLIFKANKK